MLALADWASHLAISPGRQQALFEKALGLQAQLALFTQQALTQADAPAPVQDRRFADAAWQQWPFNVLQQSFLLGQKWWEEAMRDVWGVSRYH